MSAWGEVVRRTFTVLRTRPDIALACLPPFGFIPSVRQWVQRQIAEEEAELKLRAVVRPDEIERALRLVDDLTALATVTYAESPIPTPTRAEVLEMVYRIYITTGELP
jgi:hypothetical protein